MPNIVVTAKGIAVKYGTMFVTEIKGIHKKTKFSTTGANKVLYISSAFCPNDLNKSLKITASLKLFSDKYPFELLTEG